MASSDRAAPVWRSRGRSPLVIAHRGGALEAPEHTLAAYDHAVHVGADALELDVHATADGVLVVLHDPTLDRTTPGTGDVSELTYEEIEAATGGVVPRLEEVLIAFEVPLIVDVKRTAPQVEPYEELLVSLLRAHRRTHDVIVGSFHAGALTRVGRLGPELATSLPPEEAYLLWSEAHGGDLWRPPHGRVAAQVPIDWEGITVVDEAFVETAHAHDLLVQVWTVDDPDEVELMLDLGVDAIITDRPTLVRELVDGTSTGGAARR